MLSRFIRYAMAALPLLMLSGMALGCHGGSEKKAVSSNVTTPSPLTSLEVPPSLSDTAPWAKPLVVEGAPNLFRVSKDLYRSAQPTAEGFKALRALGIETVVNLRSFHSDRSAIGNTGLAYEHIYMKAWHPEDEEVVRFLQIVSNPKRTPALVHCMQGSDRTGIMCAIYRVAIQGWSKEQALKEMKEGGFSFNEVWVNLETYLDDLDIESIKKQAGI